MFQRKRIDYDDKNGSSYYGLNVPNNKVATKKNPGRVYIAMPQNLSTAYQPTYRKVDMGVIGMGMAMGLTSTADLDGVVEMLFKLLQMQQYQKLQLEHYHKLLRVRQMP